MNAKDFTHWMDRMGLKSDSAAAELLGLGSRNTVAKYRADGAPLYIALACAALLNNIPPYAAER